ncbi:hypothetical protein [Propionibacterium freudenreichii]|uniref:hypothetical protein n=1 Tax=Propionibacterium freudenreichii TaxID=1744 RepID=UPI000541EF8C|nr:hypothetical protein [Propionibacterium freudenreichii]CEG99579.1 Protein of unknown function [Propionibacterium freudenreichii]
MNQHDSNEVSIEDDTISLAFGQLPAAQGKGRSKKWERLAAQLKARPGEWACIGPRNTSTVWCIKHGRLVAFKPAGSFEAVSRNTRGGVADCWVRYVGGAE